MRALCRLGPKTPRCCDSDLFEDRLHYFVTKPGQQCCRGLHAALSSGSTYDLTVSALPAHGVGGDALDDCWCHAHKPGARLCEDDNSPILSEHLQLTVPVRQGTLSEKKS